MKRKVEKGCLERRIVQGRIRFLSVVLPALLIIPAAKAFQLQVLTRDMLRDRAARQSRLVVKIQPRRGAILDRNGNSLAISVPVSSVYAFREQVEDKRQVAKVLARALNTDRKVLTERLESGKGFVWLKRKIAPEEARVVAEMDISGVGLQEESRRYYPNKGLAAPVLGFVGMDRGLEGLEYSLEEQLKGSAGERLLAKDGLGSSYVPGGEWAVEPSTGSTVKLTLDRTIQHFAEQALEAGAEAVEAAGGAMIVMESSTGRILAMASYPGFNPNNFLDYGSFEYKNRAVNFEYEPGSTFKIVTIAAALQDEVYDDKDIIYSGNGQFRVADVVINDPVPHGWLTLRGILRKSSNIGASRVGLQVGSERLEKYITDFGFGERMDILLPGVRSGTVRAASGWTQVDTAAIAFGQGVGVTPLQMVNAVNALATGGLLLKPYLVEKLTSSSGTVILQNRPQVLRRVISEQTARKMAGMLVSVTGQGGSGFRAAIPGYRVAGKTGTAQKFSKEEGSYSNTDFVASFAGFAPAQDPVLTAIVVIDEPARNIYGGVIAAPVWAEVVSKSLKYLGVEPEKNQDNDHPYQERNKREPVVAGNGQSLKPVGEQVMPDLAGLTLREALIKLVGFEHRIKVKGSGVVVGQNPAAGKPAGKFISVTLQPRVKDWRVALSSG
ncbi:MAG: penicillin-binding protein [bacterium]